MPDLMERTVGRPKKQDTKDDKFEMRVPSDWKARVIKAAQSIDLELPDYVRLAVNRLMNDPEFNRTLAGQRRRPKS